MKDKEQALTDFIAMISKSWTWRKLNSREQDHFLYLLSTERFTKLRIIGTYKQRYELLHGYYEMFLAGCDYEPIGWREETK